MVGGADMGTGRLAPRDAGLHGRFDPKRCDPLGKMTKPWPAPPWGATRRCEETLSEHSQENTEHVASIGNL